MAETHQLITTNGHAELLRPTLVQTQLMGLFGIKDNRNELREDSGLLTEKSNLPVIQLRSGDTGASSEDGNHTLGKLKCYGME